jgi:elongation factor P
MLANDMRKGSIIMWNNALWRAVEITHRTPGNLRAFVQAKLQNVKTGQHVVQRFNSAENVEPAWLDKRPAEYLYDDATQGPVFMDSENFEQYSLSREVLGEAMNFVKPNQHVEVTFHEGTPIGLALPSNVELSVTETEPAAKGNTVSNVQKDAKVETGYVLKVPSHINEGDRIRISTVTGEFQERVNA